MSGGFTEVSAGLDSMTHDWSGSGSMLIAPGLPKEVQEVQETQTHSGSTSVLQKQNGKDSAIESGTVYLFGSQFRDTPPN